MRVEQFADRLHLRQDQTSLRGARVDRRNEDHRVARTCEVAHERTVGSDAVLRETHHDRSELFESRAFASAREDDGQSRFLPDGAVEIRRFVRAVDDEHGGRAERAGALDDPLFLFVEGGGRRDDERHVDPFEHRERTLDAGETEVSHVVHAGRVDEDDRPEGQKFAGFLDRIGRRARHVRDDRDRLVRQGVDERTFPGVSFAEEPDVKPQALGRVE